MTWLSDAIADARYTLRRSVKRPGFAASVVLITSLGLVACVTTFSLVSGILLKPFSFPDQERVFIVDMRAPGFQSAAVPVPVYDSLVHASEVAAVGASEPRSLVIRAGDELVRVGGRAVTPSLFAVYGLAPVLGRFFADGERGVAVLEYDEWRTRHGSDSTVLGRSVIIDGSPVRIVGVIGPGFRDHSGRASFWIPREIDRGRAGDELNLVLRVADSVAPSRAGALLRRYHGRVENFETGDSLVAAVGLLPIGDLINGQVRQPLWILLGAVLLVLTLVAANIATLFTAQVGSRQAELGVRRALGASRGRQLRQLMVESLTLTAAGGAIGLGVAALLVGYIRSIGLRILPRIEEVGVDWRVALFAIAVVIVTGLAGGAAQALGTRNALWLRQTNRVASGRVPATLVTLQVGLSVVLLIGAGLLVKSFLKVAPEQPGFTTVNRATLQLTLLAEREQRLPTDAAIHRIQAALDGVAGVGAVAASTWLPMSGNIAITDVSTGSPAEQRLTAHQYLVSDNYFAVLGMKLSRGRQFTADDGAGSAPVAIISATAAARWFGQSNPIGSRITSGRGTNTHRVTVIGVVNDTRVSGRNSRVVPQVYVPITQQRAYIVTFVAATSVAPVAILPALRRAAASAAPQASINDASEIAAMVARSVDRARFFSTAMGMFATAAILLSGFGIYGVLSFAVTERRQEIGIRLALGAAPSRIGRGILGQAATIAALGAMAGVVASMALTRYLGSLLVEVEPTDPAAYSTALVLAVLSALVAAAVPVLRAVRVDPVETIRG